VDDLTISAVTTALRGVIARQHVVADNLANVETPGYTAKTVSFEDSLRNAMASGRPQDTAIAVLPSDAAPNINGNNVQIDNETMTLEQNGLQYQLMVEALNAKFGLLRDAIGKGS
jgi:flagellar basal-body rod protein FlgB